MILFFTTVQFVINSIEISCFISTNLNKNSSTSGIMKGSPPANLIAFISGKSSTNVNNLLISKLDLFLLGKSNLDSIFFSLSSNANFSIWELHPGKHSLHSKLHLELNRKSKCSIVVFLLCCSALLLLIRLLLLLSCS